MINLFREKVIFELKKIRSISLIKIKSLCDMLKSVVKTLNRVIPTELIFFTDALLGKRFLGFIKFY
jgi:hypothetical protein